MATLSALTDRVRMELGDLPIQFTTVLQGDGSTKDFYLKVKPVEAAYLNVKKTVGTTTTSLAQGTDFSVEEDLGMIHFTSAPVATASVTVTGTHYRYFSNTNISTFVNTAVEQHTYNRTDSYGRQMNIALIPYIEEYPVTIIATIEALWALATDSAFDINISAPDGVQIPRNQRFSQLTSIIAQRKEQYSEICKQLNIGLWRIEMGTLRRVSRTTNKLVPVYVPQEIDDSRKPERVYLQNDLLGRSPLPSTASVYDIVLMQGDSWEATFDFPDNFEALGDFIISAQVRSYPESPTIVATFTTAITDVNLRKLKLSLTSAQTQNFPLKSYWDLQFKKVVDGVTTFEQTYIKGLVFADRQVTDV
jgi:hypothetical protein